MSDLELHALSRELEGAAVMFPLPVCWDAEARPDEHETQSEIDALWWLSWDQGALDPTELVFGVTRDAVTCRHCLEWLHA